MQRQSFKVSHAILSLMVALVFVLSLCGDVLARGSSGGSRSGSSGSSRSFSGSSGGSWSSRSTSSPASRPSSSPTWGGKSGSTGLTTSGSRGAATTAEPSSAKTQSKSSSPSPSTTASMSKADKALYEQAKTKGTAFKTRDEAVNAFKQQNESKFKNQFSSEPSRRPDYIPEYYTGSGGARYQVAYRPELGGYGYYDSSLGRWMMYSVLADAAMTSMLMHSHGYYYGPPPGAYYGGGSGFLSTVGLFIIFALIVAAVVRKSQIKKALLGASPADEQNPSSTRFQNTQGSTPGGNVMTDLKDPSFWKDIKPGGVVVVNDEQAMMEAVKRGVDAEGGVNYEIKRVLRLNEVNGLATWTLLKLEGMDEVWLMVKIVGQEVDHRIYFEVPDFSPGNRADMIAREMFWLFEDPGPDWKAAYNDLKFIDTINIDTNPGGNAPATRTSYQQKPFGPMYARCSEEPKQSEGDEYLAILVEYSSADATDNPELLLLELGGEHGQEGGYIMMLLGCAVAIADLRVFKK